MRVPTLPRDTTALLLGLLALSTYTAILLGEVARLVTKALDSSRHLQVPAASTSVGRAR